MPTSKYAAGMARPSSPRRFFSDNSLAFFSDAAAPPPTTYSSSPAFPRRRSRPSPKSATPLLHPPLMQKPQHLRLSPLSPPTPTFAYAGYALHIIGGGWAPSTPTCYRFFQLEYELLPEDCFVVCNWSATHELHTRVLLQLTPSGRWLVWCDVGVEELCSAIAI